MQPDSLATCFHIGHEGGTFINGIGALARVARKLAFSAPFQARMQ